MTNKEKYRKAFGVLHASQWDMDELLVERSRRKFNGRILAVAVCAVLIVAGAVTAYAYGDEIKEVIRGWGGNLTITRMQNDENDISLNTDDLTDPVELRDGRMILVVNDENRDITEDISPETPYRYSYTDAEGYTHYFIIGLKTEALDSYGYGEFIQDEDGQLLGGYTARLDIEKDGSTINWMDRAKEELNCPW